MRSDPVFLRGKVYWCYVRPPFGGRGKRVSTKQRDRKAALVVWRELERQSVTPPDQAAHKTTLGSAIVRRIAERRSAGKADGTISMYEQKSRHISRILGAETPLSRVGAAEVDHFVSTRLAEGAERTTVHKELVTLRGALKLARRRGEYARSLEEVMPTDFSAEYKPRTRALSFAEIPLLLAEFPPARAAIIATIIATGATYPSELATFMAQDVDTKAWLARLRGTKRASRNRVVPIVKFARPWLTTALRHVPLEPWTNIRRDLHRACDRLSTCAACREAGELRRVKGCRTCKATPVFERVSPNDLRRTLGTLLRAHGVEPQLIGVTLGHSDSRMVERVYGRLAPEHLSHLLNEKLGAHQGYRPLKIVEKGR